MADDLDKNAIDTVAMRLLYQIHQAHLTDEKGPNPLDYKALSLEQWRLVYLRIAAVIESFAPSEHEFIAAYERLTGETP